MKSLITIIVLTLSIAVLLILFVYQKSDTLNDDLVENVTVTGTSVASNVAKFIENAQKTDGGFVSRYQCEGSECIELANNVDVPPTGYSITGLLMGAILSNNPEMRSNSDIAIDNVLRKCENDLRVCERNFYALQTYYEITGDNKYKEAIINTGEYIMDTMESNTTESLLYKNTYKKLEYLYKLTDDEAYKETVLSTTNEWLSEWPSNVEGQVIYENSGYPVMYHMPITVNGLFLPAYRLSGDKKYLNAATNFFDQASIAENLNELWWEGGMIFMLNSVEGLMALDLVISEDIIGTYGSEARIIIGEIIGWQYDSPDRPLYNSDHGIRTGILDTEPLPGVNYKNVNLNGWFITALEESGFVNHTFELYKNSPK